jgi:hypothetical protein
VNIVVLLILAVVWAVFLIPQVLRARAEHSPADSIGAFRRQLSVLERTAPGTPATAHSRAYASAAGTVTALPLAPGRPAPRAVARPGAPTKSEIRKRRRDILFGLLAAMGGTLVLGLLPPLRALLTLHLILDVVFVAYVALLIRARSVSAERELKVRFLPANAGHSAQPAFAMRRSAN